MTEILTPQVSTSLDNVDPKTVELAQSFDPFDSVATITFGKEALERITEFSDGVLDKVRVKDSGEAGDILQSMVQEMNRTEFDYLNKPNLLARLPLIGELFDSFKKFSASFDSVKSSLEKLTNQLEAQEAKLGHDIRQLDALYDENLLLLNGWMTTLPPESGKLIS